MSPEPPTPGPAPARLRCPRCGSDVAPEQDWCLECGAPARTRLAPTPNWRLPVAAVALLAVLAGIALAVAFSELTKDAAPATTGTTAAPVAPEQQPAETAGSETVPVPPPVTETQPGATTTTPPAATTTAPANPTSPTVGTTTAP